MLKKRYLAAVAASMLLAMPAMAADYNIQDTAVGGLLDWILHWRRRRRRLGRF